MLLFVHEDTFETMMVVMMMVMVIILVMMMTTTMMTIIKMTEKCRIDFSVTIRV